MRPIGKPIASRSEVQGMADGLSKAKNKVIDRVSDVMSYPARRNAQKSILASDKVFTELKAKNTTKDLQKKALEKAFRPPNMKGFKGGVGVGP